MADLAIANRNTEHTLNFEEIQTSGHGSWIQKNAQTKGMIRNGTQINNQFWISKKLCKVNELWRKDVSEENFKEICEILDFTDNRRCNQQEFFGFLAFTERYIGYSSKLSCK